MKKHVTAIFNHDTEPQNSSINRLSGVTYEYIIQAYVSCVLSSGFFLRFYTVYAQYFKFDKSAHREVCVEDIETDDERILYVNERNLPQTSNVTYVVWLSIWLTF